jgi:hypothetical protein
MNNPKRSLRLPTATRLSQAGPLATRVPLEVEPFQGGDKYITSGDFNIRLTATGSRLDSHEVERLPHGLGEEPVEIAICVPRAILAERRERHKVAALASLAALHARVEVTNGVPDSAP